MEYKLYSHGYLMQIPSSEQKEVIKIYKEFIEERERLKNIKNTAEGETEYRHAREQWLEVTNEFIGFQKCLKALSMIVVEVEGDKNG